jgi:chromosome segregation ATPase
MTYAIADIDANVLAAIAAAGGAILLKIVEKWTIRRSETLSDAARIRDELRADITRLRDENLQLEKEVNEWHEKYWTEKSLRDSDELLINAFRMEVSGGLNRIKQLETNLDTDRTDIADLEKDLEELRTLLQRLSNHEN